MCFKLTHDFALRRRITDWTIVLCIRFSMGASSAPLRHNCLEARCPDTWQTSTILSTSRTGKLARLPLDSPSFSAGNPPKDRSARHSASPSRRCRHWSISQSPRIRTVGRPRRFNRVKVKFADRLPSTSHASARLLSMNRSHRKPRILATVQGLGRGKGMTWKQLTLANGLDDGDLQQRFGAAPTIDFKGQEPGATSSWHRQRIAVSRRSVICPRRSPPRAIVLPSAFLHGDRLAQGLDRSSRAFGGNAA